MRIVLGYRSLSAFAGSETYLVTLAEQLQLLGHEVWAFTHQTGPMASVAEDRGIRVVAAEEELPASCEALLAQDGGTAHELAERYPSAARVFVAHSMEFAGQVPPQLPGTSSAVVVMNDRLRDFVESTAGAHEVVRLRQPVDLKRFAAWTYERERPRKAVAFGNDHRGLRWREIEWACREAGLEAKLVGHEGRTTATPERELVEADVVIGIGRCVVEAMACGTAAYVNGVVGGDGWVTRDSYPALEADGFSGRAGAELVDAERLRVELAAWTPELGRAGHQLAWRHHDAARHAVELVALWRRLGASEHEIASHAELARLSRVNAQLEDRSMGLAYEAAELRKRAEAAEEQLERLTSTRRWRLARTLSAPLDHARALSRRLRRSGQE